MAKQLKSAVVYRGPSQIDGAPIIVVAVAKSNNGKTGAMVQTFIVREDVNPVEALKRGLDSSVCGGCLARPAKEGWCYVRVEQSVLGVWKCFHKMEYRVTTGKRKGQLSNYAGYPELTDTDQITDMGRGRTIRLGTYGDPAAVPLWVWEALCRDANGWNGYTHQWRECSPEYSRYCMASVDRPCDVLAAEIMGYRAFVAMLPGEAVEGDQRKVAGCPASKELGAKAQCSDCLGCGGTEGRGTTHRKIVVHGVDFKTRKYAQWREKVAA